MLTRGQPHHWALLAFTNQKIRRRRILQYRPVFLVAWQRHPAWRIDLPGVTKIKAAIIHCQFQSTGPGTNPLTLVIEQKRAIQIGVAIGHPAFPGR